MTSIPLEYLFQKVEAFLIAGRRGFDRGIFAHARECFGWAGQAKRKSQPDQVDTVFVVLALLSH